MSYPEKHIALVCNPSSHNQKAVHITEDVALLLTGMNIRHSVFIFEWPESWKDCTEVWIFGGDGTLNYFINTYPDIRLPLSVFPGGSGNDFQWMLYGDITPEEQVEKVLTGIPHPVDAGMCNEHLFLNGVGIGFDGAIVKDLLGKHKLAGKASYLVSILKHLVSYMEKPCTFEMIDDTIHQDCFMISVANARRYGGGFMVAPNASLTDGMLDVNIIGRISPFKRLKYLPVIEKGAHIGLPFIQYRVTDRIMITSLVPVHAHLDGEYICAEQFEIHCLPKRFSFIW